MDRRGVEVYEGNAFLQSKNLEFYRKTGWRLDSHISFTPLYWIKKNLNSYFKEIHRIFFVNDYVIYRLSGKLATDPSNASISLLYNIIEDRWDKEILGYLDISEDFLPEVRDSGAVIGKLNGHISRKLGIKNDVILVNGGHDQYCTSISAGIFEQKQTLLSTGTAWIIFKMLDRPLFDVKSFFAIGRSILKGKFGLLYSLPASGGSIRWFANNLLNIKDEKIFFRFLERNSKKLKELKNDIIYYPYLAGTFDPDFDQNAKASFTGIDISNSGLDFIKAIMEGVSFHIKKVFLAIREKGVETNTIRMVGGGAKDIIWTQITADVLNMEIAVPKYPEEDFAVKGAAILANYGLNRKMNNKLSIYDSYRLFQSEFDNIRPDSDNVNFYLKKYRDFEVYLNKLYSSSR
jgi:sugar (pentulose or hexulose) kinase